MRIKLIQIRSLKKFRVKNNNDEDESIEETPNETSQDNLENSSDEEKDQD